jgi:hypothetical protein
MPSLFEYQEKRGDSMVTKIIVFNKLANIEIQEFAERADVKLLFVGGVEKNVVVTRDVAQRLLKDFRNYMEKHH